MFQPCDTHAFVAKAFAAPRSGPPGYPVRGGLSVFRRGGWEQPGEDSKGRRVPPRYGHLVLMGNRGQCSAASLRAASSARPATSQVT